MAVLVALGSLGCSHGSSTGTAPPPPTVAAPPTTVHPSADEVVEAVRVVDSGVTNGQTVRGYDAVSYGFVIENTSDQVLQHVPLTTLFYDAAGELIDEGVAYNAASIPLLWPGEQVGFGGMELTQPGVAEVRVEVGEPQQWMPEAQAEAMLTTADWVDGSLTVDEVGFRQGEDGEPIATFTVRSSYEHPVDVRSVYAVFYDADGGIVGGARSEYGFSIDPGATHSSEAEPDAAGDPIEVPNIDPARTRIYVPGVRVAQR